MINTQTPYLGFTRIIDGVLAKKDHIRGDIIFLYNNRLRRIRPNTDSYNDVLRLLPTMQWTEKYPPSPNSIQIQVTKACNLACSFCYANAINSSSPESHMTLNQAKHLIDIAYEWGVPQLQWVGGEAFVNKDFPKIVEYAKNLGLVQNIITNGIIPGIRLEKFTDTLRSFATIQISANAVGDDFNALVGRSVYDRFISAVQAINDLCGTVWLSCVVTQKNASSLGDIVSLAERTGIRGITFGILAKQGRATADESADYFQCLTEAQRSLRRVYEKSKPSIEIDCHFSPDLSLPQSNFEKKYIHGSDEGHKILFINKDGDVFPFPLLEESKLWLGNAFKNNLADIWKSSNVLKSLRSDHTENTACGECNVDCALRSKSLRYLWTGDFSGKLPCYKFDFTR